MALHGDISVNGEVIGRWQARRRTLSVNPDGTAEYDCVASMYADNPPRARTCRLTHRYDDGAMVLAAKVLTALTGADR